MFFRSAFVIGLLSLTVTVAVGSPAHELSVPRRQEISTRAALGRKVVVRGAMHTAKLAPVRVVPAVDVLHDHGPVTIRGGVTGASGMPLPGATVWFTHTHRTVAVTNSAGDFTFTLPNNAPISLSCGYGGYVEQIRVLSRPAAQEELFFALQAQAKRNKSN